MSKKAQPLISDAERRRREEAVNYGIASGALEGFSVPDAYKTEAERFIRGEIEFPALLAAVDEIAQDV